jgi:hypothetical protein
MQKRPTLRPVPAGAHGSEATGRAGRRLAGFGGWAVSTRETPGFADRPHDRGALVGCGRVPLPGVFSQDLRSFRSDTRALASCVTDEEMKGPQ